jgi:DNA-binding MarR family transcriptional regulator
MGIPNEITRDVALEGVPPDADALRASCGMPECLARYSGALLVRAATLSKLLHTAAMAPLGLRPREYAALLTLRGEGAVSQQALGRFLRVDPGSVVDLVDELEGRGLVERRRNPADRRAYEIHLTQAGAEALDGADEAAAQAEELILAGLSAEERETLRALLLRVLGDGPSRTA